MIKIRAIPRRSFLAGVAASGAATLLGLRASRGEAVIDQARPIGPQASLITPTPRTIMLDRVTISDFAPHVGEKFELEGSPEGVSELELLRAEALGYRSQPGGAGSGHREPFSLLFAGPEGTRLYQDIYTIKHSSLGTFSLFLVPVGPARQETRIRYEAIFA